MLRNHKKPMARAATTLVAFLSSVSLVLAQTNITAPPNWPKPGTSHNDPTSTYNWIKETWPQVA